MRAFFAILVALLIAGAAQAKLEIRDVQASYGQLGPERKSADYVQGDAVYVRFFVHGVRTDMDGKIRGELLYRVVDANGKKLLESAVPVQQVLAVGGDSFSGYASVTLAVDFPTGDYQLEVEYADTLAKETVSFQYKFTCKPLEFALVELRFFQDEQGRVPAAVGGLINQTLFIRFRAVGFDRSKGEIDLEMTVQVFDKEGKALVPKPIRAVVHNEDAATVKNALTANFSAQMALNRTGEFQLKITLTDTLAKKTVSFEAPLRVRAP